MGLNPLDLLRTQLSMPPVPNFPAHQVLLPGRGLTKVTDIPGPAGAPTIVLLHAVGNTGLLTWFPVLTELAKKYRVVTFDQRWHGNGIQSEYFSIYDCADDVAALIEVLELEQVIVAGYSMGSIIAQRVWRQHGEKISGLILAASTARFRNTWPEKIFHEGLELSMGALRTVARSQSVRKAADLTADILNLEPSDTHRWALEQWRQTSPWAVAQAVAALGRHNSQPWLKEIDVPTAVVIMENDHVIPPRHQHHLAEKINGATHHLIPAGHAGCVLETEVFVPGFLEAVKTTAARINDRPKTQRKLRSS